MIEILCVKHCGHFEVACFILSLWNYLRRIMYIHMCIACITHSTRQLFTIYINIWNWLFKFDRIKSWIIPFHGNIYFYIWVNIRCFLIVCVFFLYPFQILTLAMTLYKHWPWNHSSWNGQIQWLHHIMRIHCLCVSLSHCLIIRVTMLIVT